MREPMRPAATALLLALVVCLGAACSQAGPDRASGTDAAVEDAEQPDVGSSDVVAIKTDASEAGATDGAEGGDAGGVSGDGGEDAGDGCFLTTVGVYGQCMTTAACAALGSSTSTPGYCPGPADIECCTPTPNVADNPPVPMGWVLMQQSAVTSDMTTWAVQILDDPTMYPMFSTTIKTFGTLMVLARVEWHPPDFQNSAIHRGVTLYQPE
jgi:hypothetical protein